MQLSTLVAGVCCGSLLTTRWRYQPEPSANYGRWWLQTL